MGNQKMLRVGRKGGKMRRTGVKNLLIFSHLGMIIESLNNKS